MSFPWPNLHRLHSEARAFNAQPGGLRGGCTCQGQALAEALVVLLALLSLWIGSAWLARFQDMALQASHASRYAAFSHARQVDTPPLDHIRQHYFSGRAHRWSDRRGAQILGESRSEVSLSILPASSLRPQAQPGGSSADASALRQSWGLQDGGIARAAVAVSFNHFGAQAARGTWGSGLRDFDGVYPSIVRHTSILALSGHAGGDQDVQRRVQASRLAWGASAQTSLALARTITADAHPVDAAWGRPRPTTDWLQPWAGQVPPRHTASSGGPK